MKILVATGVFPPDIGGPASYAKTILGPLSGLADVRVIAFSSVRRHAGDGELPYPVKRIWTRIPWGARHIVFFFACWSAARWADKVYLLNASTAGFTGSVAAMLARKPTLVRIVGDYAWEMAALKGRTFLLLDDFQKTKRHGRAVIFHRMQSWVCGRAETVIVPSRYLAGVVRGWGVPEKKIAVIYNGTDFEPVALPREQARKEIGVAGNIILSAGRLVPWKGFRMLIKVMPQLLQVDQFARLVIVGDGPLTDELKGMARTLGLERKVFIVGAKSRSELAVYLAAADMFVLNTGYEGFSHQLLEAMRAGVPVVTTTAGGNRELVEQGENGFMVKYNDEFNLVEAIKSIWRSDDIRKKFAANGRATAAKFSAERMLAETLEILVNGNQKSVR